MKVFLKCFGIIVFTVITALALAGCSPQVESVVVNSNGANSIGKGNTMNFSATVTGKNNPSQNVKWSVSSKSDGSGAVADGTNISPGGTLIVDAKETAANIYVRATASQSEDKYDYVQLKVEAASSAPRTQSAVTADSTKPGGSASTATATPTTATPAASTTTTAGGFQMSGTTLTKYTGSGGSVTIPNSVTRIDVNAFRFTALTSVTFQGTIKEANFESFSFDGNLRERYLEDGSVPGTYTRARGSNEWQRQAQGA